MAIEVNPTGSVRSGRNSAWSRRWLTWLGLAYLGGCSLQDLSPLTSGNSTSAAGSGQSGSAGESQRGGAPSAAGSSSVAGAANPSGAPSTGGATLATGGTSNVAGASNAAGATSIAGASGKGGTSSTCSTDPDPDLSGCTLAKAAGQLLVPPSQGFEVALNGWTTTAAHTTALTLVPGNGANCEGSMYLNVNGAIRTAEWDGPALEVGSLLTVGHVYQYSMAVRKTPSSTCTPPVTMKLVISRSCSSDTYDDLQTGSIQTKWTRLTGVFTLATPAGCTTALSSVKLYVATIETAAIKYASFDMDDFRLTDLSAGGTAGGAAGASGSGGASGSVATAGAAGR